MGVKIFGSYKATEVTLSFRRLKSPRGHALLFFNFLAPFVLENASEMDNHYPVGQHIPVKVMYGSAPTLGGKSVGY